MERGVCDDNPIGAGKRRGTIAPMPEGADVLVSGWLAGAPSGGRTARVFSVLRFRTSLSAMACSAVLSFWPSDSLSGARVLRSMI
jgi:hypothetical protein